jgi:hypothetical protein
LWVYITWCESCDIVTPHNTCDCRRVTTFIINLNNNSHTDVGSEQLSSEFLFIMFFSTLLITICGQTTTIPTTTPISTPDTTVITTSHHQLAGEQQTNSRMTNREREIRDASASQVLGMFLVFLYILLCFSLIIHYLKLESTTTTKGHPVRSTTTSSPAPSQYYTAPNARSRRHQRRAAVDGDVAQPRHQLAVCFFF